MVRDLATGLEWQRHVGAESFDWCQARTHCQELTPEGGGWRLPSRIDLLSLLDFSRITPTIKPRFPAWAEHRAVHRIRCRG